MNHVKTLLVLASAAFSTIPGLATIREGLLAPPGYEALFAGFATSIGVLTFACMAVSRRRLREASRGRLVTTAILFITGALVCVSAYIYIRETTVIPVRTGTGPDRRAVVVRHYIPLFPRRGGNLERRLRSPTIENNRSRLVQRHQSDIRRWTGEEDMWLTTTVFLLTHVGMISFITAAFGAIGFGYREDADPVPTPPPDG